MGTDNRLRRFLNRLTDTLVVGLLVIAASIPVVTAFAALRAGAAALADPGGGRSLARRFTAALRPALREGLLPGIAFSAGAGVGLVDIATAASGRLGLATVPVEAAGLALLLSAAVLPAWAAALSRSTPPAGTLALLRHAVLAAAARPALSAGVLGAVLAGTAAVATAPVLAPAAAGTLALLAAHLPALALRPATSAS